VSCFPSAIRCHGYRCGGYSCKGDPINQSNDNSRATASVVTNTVCLVFKYFAKYSTKLSI